MRRKMLFVTGIFFITVPAYNQTNHIDNLKMNISNTGTDWLFFHRMIAANAVANNRIAIFQPVSCLGIV